VNSIIVSPSCHRLAEVKRASLIALVVVVMSAGCADHPTTSTGAAPKASVPVTDVVDGDTIHVLLHGRTERIRLIGVDAPEIEHPPQPAECFGVASATFAAGALREASVRIEFDVERRDRFGRLLAYVFRGDELFNAILVSRGFAIERAYPPNLARQEELRIAETEARRNLRGLWGACQPHG
jgi:micrococcal nuclease